MRDAAAQAGVEARGQDSIFEEEVKMLPAIGAALDELEIKEHVKEKCKTKCKLKTSDLDKIIKEELAR